MSALFKSSAVDTIIVGLGNPGREYESTRHNAGFMALDALADSLSARVDRVKWNALTGVCEINGHKVLLMKPQTFMNCSGEAVQPAMAFYKLQPKNILVLLDDVNLDVGIMRIRKTGSDGGQKGMRSIIQQCSSCDIARIKIGVGKKPEGWDMADWVLSRFTKDEADKMSALHKNIISAAELIIDGQADKATNLFSH